MKRFRGRGLWRCEGNCVSVCVWRDQCCRGERCCVGWCGGVGDGEELKGVL